MAIHATLTRLVVACVFSAGDERPQVCRVDAHAASELHPGKLALIHQRPDGSGCHGQQLASCFIRQQGFRLWYIVVTRGVKTQRSPPLPASGVLVLVRSTRASCTSCRLNIRRRPIRSEGIFPAWACALIHAAGRPSCCDKVCKVTKGVVFSMPLF